MHDTHHQPSCHTLQVAKGEKTGRIDSWLASRISTMSRSRIQQLLRTGNVTVDNVIATPRTNLQPGMTVCLTEPPPVDTYLTPQDIPLDILYEDDLLIAINKQPGLVVHPAPGHPDQTLVNALLHHCPNLEGIGGERRPGIVHRLDADTSGVIVVAKTDFSMGHITAQFAARTTRKLYIAVCHGVPAPGKGTIETLIGRSSHNRKKMSVNSTRGRNAVTHFKLKRALPHNTALLEVRIETGRTHQIRVHLAHIRHPVVGDSVYGRKNLDKKLPTVPTRQLLHAESLTISHPSTNMPITFSAPLPQDMQAMIQSA